MDCLGPKNTFVYDNFLWKYKFRTKVNYLLFVIALFTTEEITSVKIPQMGDQCIFLH